MGLLHRDVLRQAEALITSVTGEIVDLTTDPTLDSGVWTALVKMHRHLTDLSELLELELLDE
jgi:hypothetical protein